MHCFRTMTVSLADLAREVQINATDCIFMKVCIIKYYQKLYFTIQRKSVQFIVSMQAPWHTGKWLC